MTIHKEGRTLLFVLLLVLSALSGQVTIIFSEVVRNIIIGVSAVLYLIVLQFSVTLFSRFQRMLNM